MRAGFAAVEIHGLHGRHQFHPDAATDVAIDVAWVQVNDLTANPPQLGSPVHPVSPNSLFRSPEPPSVGFSAAAQKLTPASNAKQSKKAKKEARRAAAAALRDSFGCVAW